VKKTFLALVVSALGVLALAQTVTEQSLTSRSRRWTARQQFESIAMPECRPDPPSGTCRAQDTCISFVQDQVWVCENGVWGFLVGAGTATEIPAAGDDQDYQFNDAGTFGGTVGLGTFNDTTGESKFKIVNGVRNAAKYATSGDGASSSTPWVGALEAVFADSPSNVEIQLPKGYFKLTSTLTLTGTDFKLIGAGIDSTFIECAGTAECIKWNNPAGNPDAEAKAHFEGFSLRQTGVLASGKATFDLGDRTQEFRAIGTFAVRDVRIYGVGASITSGTAFRLNNANHGVVDHMVIDGEMGSNSVWALGMSLFDEEPQNRGNTTISNALIWKVHVGIRMGKGTTICNNVKLDNVKIVNYEAACRTAGSIGLNIWPGMAATNVVDSHFECFETSVKFSGVCLVAPYTTECDANSDCPGVSCVARGSTVLQGNLFGHFADDSGNLGKYGVWINDNSSTNVIIEGNLFDISDCTNCATAIRIEPGTHDDIRIGPNTYRNCSTQVSNASDSRSGQVIVADDANVRLDKSAGIGPILELGSTVNTPELKFADQSIDYYFCTFQGSACTAANGEVGECTGGRTCHSLTCRQHCTTTGDCTDGGVCTDIFKTNQDWRVGGDNDRFQIRNDSESTTPFQIVAGTDQIITRGGANPTIRFEKTSGSGNVAEVYRSDADSSCLKIYDAFAPTYGMTLCADASNGTRWLKDDSTEQMRLTPTGTFRVAGIPSCDTIDTDGSGGMACGTDDDTPESNEFGALALTGPITSVGLATTINTSTVNSGMIVDGTIAPADVDKTVTWTWTGQTSMSGTVNPMLSVTKSGGSGEIAVFRRTDANSACVAVNDVAGTTYSELVCVDDANGTRFLNGATEQLRINPSGHTVFTLGIEQGTAPANTTEGRLQWDTNDDALIVGTGSGTTTIGAGGGGGDIASVGDCASGDCYQAVGPNLVFAGASTGTANSQAAFRALVDADFPATVTLDSQVPGLETDPGVPLLALSDHGNLCAGGEAVRRNAGDTANECFTPGTSGVWTDADPMAQSTTTRDVQIGPTFNNTAKLSVDGDADQVQLSVQGNATQTSSLIVAESSDGTDQFTLSNAGAAVFSGAVSGSNLSGTNTGDQTSVSGNAGTVTVADAASDTTTWPLLGVDQTGSLSPRTDAGLTYNSSTDALTATTFAGALSGNATSATTATTATTANAGDSATAFFTTGAIEVARGGTGAAPGADDQVLVADSTSAATWRSIGDCVDTGGNHLNYTAATNTFSCGTSGGGSGDSVRVETSAGPTYTAATDADLRDTATIDFSLNTGASPDEVTADVKANSLSATQIDETGNFDWTGIHTFDSDGVQIDDTNASHQLVLTPGSDLTADRVLTITTGDAARTLTMTGDASIAGTNTGDQTTVSGNAGTVTVADAGSDTTTWPLLGIDTTGSLSPRTDAHITYNANTNALTTTTFVGALTGNADTATTAGAGDSATSFFTTGTIEDARLSSLVVLEASSDTLTNKTIAGLGSGTTHGTANFVSVNRHATDCTAITDGVDGELCWEKDANVLYTCEPTAGGCDTPGEWVTSGGGSGDVTDVGDCDGPACFTAAAGDGNALTFEGTTADGFETQLTGGDPNADRTITLPDASGEVDLHPWPADGTAGGTRRAFCYPTLTSTNSMNCAGVAVPTVSGTSFAITTLTRPYQQMTSATQNSSDVGPVGSLWALPAWKNKARFQIRTGSLITTYRMWFGFSQGSMNTGAGITVPTTSVASTQNYVAVGYQSGVNSGKFGCCSGNGTSHSCDDMGITVATNTEYTITIDWTTSTQVTCTVNGTAVTKTTLIPTSTSTLYQYIMTGKTLAASARVLSWSRLELEGN
jgi:hypothetical protein